MKKSTIIVLLLLLLVCILIKKTNSEELIIYPNNIRDSFTFQPPDDSKTPIFNSENPFSKVVINPPSDKQLMEGQYIPSLNEIEIVDKYKSPKYLKYVNESRGYSVYFEPEVKYMA